MVIEYRQHADLLRRYLRPYWPKALLLALLLSGSVGLQLATPQLLRHFIDQALGGSGVEALATTAVIFLAMALVNELAVAAAAYAGEDVAWSATNRLHREHDHV